MNYWKELDCNNYVNINQEILSWIERQPFVKETNEFWNQIDTKDLINSCPLFKQWLLDQKLYVKSIAVTYGTHVNCCGVHIDTPPAKFKLSWPVKNTKGTWNRWFKETGSSEKFVNYNGGTSFKDLSGLEEIARNELLVPCIIDAGIPHDVWYPDTTIPIFPRIGLQGHLIKEPSSL